MSEETPPPLYTRKKLPIESEIKPLQGGSKRIGVLLFGMLAFGATIWAGYNAFVLNLPLTSPYVIAPAVGAVWFGLRLFMSLTPKG